MSKHLPVLTEFESRWVGMATRHGFLVWIKIGSHGGMAW